MDNFARIPASQPPRVYSRKGVVVPPQGPSTSQVADAEKSKDVWEQLKRSAPSQVDDGDFTTFKLGSLPRPRLAPRPKIIENPSLLEKKNLRKELQVVELESLVVSKSKNPPLPSTSQTAPLSVKRKSPSNPYDFDDEEDFDEGKTGAISSSQGSSSQGSNASTGSVKGPSRKKMNGGVTFRKPAPPGPKTRLPTIKKAESFPPTKAAPSRKRPPTQAYEIEPPRKISSPDKPSSRGNELSKCSEKSSVPVSCNGQAPKVAVCGKPTNDLKVVGKGDVKTSSKPNFIPILPISEIYDVGEVDGWKDEIDFLMGSLKAAGNNNVMNRCLSAIKLANKLLDPGFRLEFFAHASLGVFDVLRDAAGSADLSLCMAAIVLVLSTDSLKMNLDRSGLRLLANILEKAPSIGPVTKQLVEGVQLVVGRSKFGKELSSDVITAPRLILEALMTMKLGSQLSWFIDEIRRQGLIEHLINHLVAVLPILVKKPTTTTLSAVHRISEFFYKVMHDNKENSMCFVSICQSAGFKTLVKVIKLCVNQLKEKNQSQEVRAELGVVLRSVLSLLVNLSGHADLYRSMMGSQPDLMESLIQACFNLEGVLPRDKAQEILIRSLLCIVNLTFNCESNCRVFMEVPSVNSATKSPNLLLFIKLMKKTSDDAVTSGDDLDRCTEQYGKMIRAIEQDADITITDVLDKAGENMEHFAIMCYDGLLLGHLVMQNEDAKEQLKGHFQAVFSSVSEAITVATGAIKRMTEFVTDAKAENVHPIHEMHAAVDALENYGYCNS